MSGSNRCGLLQVYAEHLRAVAQQLVLASFQNQRFGVETAFAQSSVLHVHRADGFQLEEAEFAAIEDAVEIGGGIRTRGLFVVGDVEVATGLRRAPSNEEQRAIQIEGAEQCRLAGHRDADLMPVHAAEVEGELARRVDDARARVAVEIEVQRLGRIAQGAKRDDLQGCIALVTKSITDFPIKYGNFRD